LTGEAIWRQAVAELQESKKRILLNFCESAFMHDGFAAKAAPTGYKHTWESNQPAAGKFSDLAA